MIKTVIVGYGYAAKTFHIPFILKNRNFELVGFVERGEARSQADFKSIPTFKNLTEAVNVSKASLVIITTPNQTHYAFAKQALELGCHVLVEKPATISVEESIELETISKNKGLNCFVFHNRRYDGDYLTFKKAVNDGLLGRVVQVEMRFDRWAPTIRAKAWKESGELGAELLDDLGSHLIDQATDLFGDLTFISSWSAKQRTDSSIRDSFVVLCKSGDILIELRAGMLMAMQPIKFIAHGSKGSLLITGTDGQEAQLKSGVSVLDPDFGIQQRGQECYFCNGAENRIIPLEKGSYFRFYQEMGACILGQGVAPVSIGDAIKVMKIIEEAR